MKDQDALVQWIVEQQRASSLSKKQPATELHLHQHHHPATPPPAAEFERRSERMHPLFVAIFMLFVSIAISVPLALLAAIVDSSNRPDVQYVQPNRGGW